MANTNVCPSPKRFNNVDIILPPIAENFSTTGNPTFGEAAAHYCKAGGEARYLPPIVSYFGDTLLKALYPAHIRAMADAIYPECKGSTKNRQAITPARAVILHGYEHGWCNRITVKRFKVEKPQRRKAATPVWLYAFCRQAELDDLPHVAAIVLFMATTGARVSEAIALHWPEVDLTARTALLLKTKTSTNSLRYLTDDVAARLRDLQRHIDQHQPVFRYKCRHSVNERIAAICKRAGIPNKPPHTCGRRTFATRAIELGMDVSTAMKAGGWESSAVFLEIYVQPRINAGRMVADRFALDDFGAL